MILFLASILPGSTWIMIKWEKKMEKGSDEIGWDEEKGMVWNDWWLGFK